MLVSKLEIFVVGGDDVSILSVGNITLGCARSIFHNRFSTRNRAGCSLNRRLICVCECFCRLCIILIDDDDDNDNWKGPKEFTVLVVYASLYTGRVWLKIRGISAPRYIVELLLLFAIRFHMYTSALSILFDVYLSLKVPVLGVFCFVIEFRRRLADGH